MIRLNVPYAEKNDAKKLGARWNKEQKFWYVPDNVDFHPFKSWITPETWNELTHPASVITFSDLFTTIAANTKISAASYTVKADVNDLKAYKDTDKYYLYTVLANHNTRQKIKIKIQKQIFDRDLLGIKPEDLIDKSVTVTGTPSLYDKYLTMQLNVSAIKVNGDCSRKVESEAWAQKYQDLFQKKDNIKYPLIPFDKVGLITGENTDACSDFMDKLNHGHKVAEENVILKDVKVTDKDAIVKAIEELNDENECQIICIVRGGGNPEDLFTFSQPEILQAIYSSKIPVIVGIGHQQDDVLCNHVARCDARTPSGAAECLNYIIGKLRKDENLRRAYESRRKTEHERSDWKTRCLELEVENEDLKEQIRLLNDQLDKLSKQLPKKSKRGFFSSFFD